MITITEFMLIELADEIQVLIIENLRFSYIIARQ